MKSFLTNKSSSRRKFIKHTSIGLGAGLFGLQQVACTDSRKTTNNAIQGFEETEETESSKKWVPVSDRKIRVGIVGYGVCKFGAAFGFQDHPNVEIICRALYAHDQGFSIWRKYRFIDDTFG